MLPLELRLPNATALFTGREAQLAWLDQAAPRAPLTLIYGAHGVGKTELVLRWFQRREQAMQAQRVIYLSLPRYESQEALALALLMQLARAQDDPERLGVDLRAAARQPLDALASMLDLVDKPGIWVVWDDAHRMPQALLEALLPLLHRYVRAARWIVIGEAFTWQPLGQSLCVEALELALRQQLITSWSASGARALSSERAHALAAEHQSLVALEEAYREFLAPEPLELELMTPRPDDPLTLLLGLLSVSQRPIPAQALLEMSGCEADMLHELERAGWLNHAWAGWRLSATGHAKAARVLPSPLDEALMTRIIKALSSASAPIDLTLEAARFALEQGQDEALDASLSARFMQLRDAGYLSELWSYLRAHDRPALMSWRLRVASVLGDVQALSRLDLPESFSWESLSYWLNALQHLGQLNQLVSLGLEVMAGLEPIVGASRMYEDSVYLIIASAQLALGMIEGSQSLLRDRQWSERWQEASAEMIQIRALAQLGERDQALERLARYLVDYQDLERVHVMRHAYTIIYVYYILQELGQAATIARQFFDDPQHPVILVGTQWILLGAIATDTGDFDRGRRFAQRALAQYQSPSFNRASALGVFIHACIYEGLVDEADEHCLTLVRELDRDAAELLAHARCLALRIAIMRGESLALSALPAHDHAGDEQIPAEGIAVLHQTQRLYALHRALEPAAYAGVEHDGLHVQAQEAALKAYGALRRGLGFELERLQGWIDRLIVAGWHRAALDLAYTACEVALVSAPQQLKARALVLKGFASACRSPRLLDAARFFELCAQDKLEPAQIEAFLVEHPRDPQSVRRLRALAPLADHPSAPLDELDLKIVAALMARHEWAQPPEGGALGLKAQRASLWGYIASERLIWSATGRQTELGSKLLMHKFICALAEQPHGELDKEGLMQQVWGEREYHPLNHDNKLRLLVRKLRKVLADALGEGDWLITTEEGYKLLAPFEYKAAPQR